MTFKVNLVDNSFNHDIGIVAGKMPKAIEWDRTLSQSGITFYTNKMAYQNKDNIRNPAAFLLTEPTTILRYTPELVSHIIDKFDVFFTHDSRYHKIWPEKCRWINGGGIWIGGKLGGGSIGIKQKSKLCSLVSSRKIFCDLHLLRANLAVRLRECNCIDVYGTIINEDSWISINKTLDDYYYSIIIENYIDDLYFTEKLLNCFAVGTIPIYIGAKKISSIFDGNGIIQINIEDKSIHQIYEELITVIGKLSPEDYHYRLPAVMNNYNKCLQFETIEDYIYNNYQDDLR